MNTEAAVILLIIAVAVVAVFGQQVQEIVLAGQTFLQASGVQSGIGINPKAGQQVCDLKLVFQPNLIAQAALASSGSSDNGAFISPIAAWSMPSGAKTVSWQNCHAYGLPLSWAPWSNSANGTRVLQPADILLSTGYTDHIWLTVLGPNGSVKSYLTDPLCLSLCATAQIPSGAVFVPKSYTFTFLITNIPRQSYQIQLTSELPFNGQNAGAPYTQNVSG